LNQPFRPRECSGHFSAGAVPARKYSFTLYGQPATASSPLAVLVSALLWGAWAGMAARDWLFLAAGAVMAARRSAETV